MVKHCWKIALFITCLTCIFNANAAISVNHLRCEYKNNPTGIDCPNPRLSWSIESDQRGVKQTAYQILVASSKEKLLKGDGDLWDSGKVRSSNSIQQEYQGQALQSHRTVFWKVRIWDQDDNASPWSEPAFWTNGVMKTDHWKASWVGLEPTAPFRQEDGLPLFRNEFNVKKTVRSAVVSVCGLGQYELFINGDRVGDHFLDPTWSVYEKTVYYNTFDVTDQLQRGGNAFGVMLGKGFYNTQGDRRVHGVNNDGSLKLILQCNVQYADKTRDVFCSDGSWKAAHGPVTHSAILAGEDYDARRSQPGWTAPRFDDGDWANASVVDTPPGVLKAAVSEPMQEMQTFQPVQIDALPNGDFVYDFGQNASAIPSLIARGKPGQSLRLTPAEQRHGQSPERANNGSGPVNQAGVGSPNYYQYTIGSDRSESWRPQFTYGGFQYIQVSGAVPNGNENPGGLPVIESLRSIHVRNAAAEVGGFECSNPLFNRIDSLIDWAVKSNLGHVLTDCPTREKLGWLEVSYLMGPSMSRKYDLAALYSKKAQDIEDSQDDSGEIFTVAPNYPKFDGGFRYTPEWGAAGAIIPWQLYRWYGDERILEEHFDAMKRFVDSMKETSENLVPRAGLGDWYDYGHGEDMGPSRFTSPQLTAMATFYRCCIIVADSAHLLGKTDENQQYEDLAEQIKSAFNTNFYEGNGRYKNEGSPQTANAIALSVGLADSENKDDVLKSIVDDLKQRNFQQTAGDVGFYYLVDALASLGEHEVIFQNVNRNAEGSYGYILDLGWNSMPEAWNANTSASMNHCMLGHIQQWFYHYLLGIQQAEGSIGFKQIVIDPAVVDGLEWASGYYDSIHGRISCDWKKSGQSLTLKVSIPTNTTATIHVPTIDADKITESGRPVQNRNDVDMMGMENSSALFKVGSGNYTFTSLIHE